MMGPELNKLQTNFCSCIYFSWMYTLGLVLHVNLPIFGQGKT